MNGSVSDMLVSRGKRVEGGVKLSVVEMPAGKKRKEQDTHPPGEREKRQHIQSLLLEKHPPRPSTGSPLRWEKSRMLMCAADCILAEEGQGNFLIPNI